MDIHKPKPWHGFRELLKEVGTIVIGVLIALGAEQAVEWLHWNHRVAETRAQLDREVGSNATNSLGWLANAPCLEARLATLSKAVAEARRTGAFRAPAQKYAPTLTLFTNDAWLNARSLQVSDHMQPEVMRRYTYAFFFPTELAPDIATLHSLAGELDLLDQDLDHVSPAEAGEWAVRIGRIREIQARSELAMIDTLQGAERVHAAIRVASAQDIAAFHRQAEGACVADPAEVLAVVRDKSLGARQKFAKLGLTPPRGL